MEQVYVSVQVSKSYYEKLMAKALTIEPSLKSPSFDMLLARVVEFLDDVEKGDKALIFDLEDDLLDVRNREDSQFLRYLKKKTANNEKQRKQTNSDSRKKKEAGSN